MTEEISAYNEFILKSAEKYIHTVVLIDDRIYESKSGSVAAALAKPPSGRRKVALKSAATSTVGLSNTLEAVEDTEEPEEVSFHDVQNSFAKKRIVCSLYQPRRDASFGERSKVYSLCSSADIVIVDWDLHGDPGIKATALVGNLIEQSMNEIPYQLRLVLIYTMEVNLRSVADKIFEDLTKRLGEENIVVDLETDGLVLKTTNARVVVLGKRSPAPVMQYSNFWVSEKKLAERTIAEFSQLASGLLQAIVLRGIARLRENDRRILMRFNKSLDAPFLINRALLLPDETINQIIPLLTEELRAVLEDTLGEFPLGDGHTGDRIIADWCAKTWRPGDDPKLNIGDGADANQFAQDVFCNGSSLRNDYSKFRKSDIPGLVDTKDDKQTRWKESKVLKLAEYLASNSEMKFCHQKLSSLMSQRIAYDNACRTLHLGVIVKEMAGQQRYLLCLQPVCDSVRIRGKTIAFIFCCLDVYNGGKRFTHAVLDSEGRPVELNYNPKASNVHLGKFTADADTINAVRERDGRYVFQDVGKNKYEWVAELKTEHAQRAAEEFGRTLSRVGLTESEWLRFKAKGQ